VHETTLILEDGRRCQGGIIKARVPVKGRNLRNKERDQPSLGLGSSHKLGHTNSKGVVGKTVRGRSNQSNWEGAQSRGEGGMVSEREEGLSDDEEIGWGG